MSSDTGLLHWPFWGVSARVLLPALLVEAAGAAFQAVSQVRLMKYCRGVKPDPLDSCVAWDSAGEMVKRQWPDWYKAGNDGTAD